MRICVILLPGLLFLFGSCTNHKQHLIGSWQAKALLEENDTLEVDLPKIHFQFLSNDRYSFSSLLNYHEAGLFHLEGMYLHTLDTTRKQAEEKTVKLLHLSTDSMVMKMQHDGKQRILLLTR